MWQHVQLSEQIRPSDTLACCWDVKQPTNQQTNPTELGCLVGTSDLWGNCGAIYTTELGCIVEHLTCGAIYTTELGSLVGTSDLWGNLHNGTRVYCGDIWPVGQLWGNLHNGTRVPGGDIWPVGQLWDNLHKGIRVHGGGIWPVVQSTQPYKENKKSLYLLDNCHSRRRQVCWCRAQGGCWSRETVLYCTRLHQCCTRGWNRRHCVSSHCRKYTGTWAADITDQ